MWRRGVSIVWIIVFVLVLGPLSARAKEPIRIYIDADWSIARAASHAIEQGLMTALTTEKGLQLGGLPVEIVRKDHRANSRRSLDNLRDFLGDENALLVVTGIHSPPLLYNLDFINEAGILTLVPWAAAGPITRAKTAENWIFRLSIDDSKAGRYIVNYTLRERGFRRPALLLEDTGWGRSNEKTMSFALDSLNVIPAGIFWFNWGITPAAASIMLQDIYASGADCIVFVGNVPEARTFVNILVRKGRGEILPVCSHWGITGGDFAQSLGPDILGMLDLQVLQTRFSFIGLPEGHDAQAVFERAKRIFPNEIREASDISPPTGFIHAYDLGLILKAAVKQAGGLTGEMRVDRKRIHKALEHLEEPVAGLIRTYDRPFRPYTPATPDAHEALGVKDLRMGRFATDGTIILMGGREGEGF